jgi:hypothetical protein
VDVFVIVRLGRRIGDRKVQDILDRLREIVGVGVDPLEDVLMTAIQTLAELVAEDIEVAQQGLNR